MASSGARRGLWGPALGSEGAASSPNPLSPAHPREGLFHCSPQARPTRPSGGLIPAQAPPIFRHGGLLSQVAAPPTCPTPPPTPIPSLPGPYWARAWLVIITAPARLSPSNFITGTPHLWTCPWALWELYAWNPRVEATCPGSPGGTCGHGCWRRSAVGGPLSGASCPETCLSWHASSELSLRPAVFSSVLMMLCAGADDAVLTSPTFGLSGSQT